jgi:hypothetical protein
MYSLVWQSVMWRPGKLWFLIGVKNPLPIRPAATARKQGPLRGRAGRQIRRHFLILIDARFSSRLSRSKPDRSRATKIGRITSQAHEGQKKVGMRCGPV